MAKTDIQQDIQDTIAEIVHLNVVAAQLDETTRELNAQYDQMDRMNKDLNKELRDIEKLEGFSTKAIFHKILGSKEEQLEKERQEYLELTLQYENLQNSIKILEYEVNLLEAKVGSKENLELRLSNLKGLREKEIIESDPLLRDKLLNISQKLEENYHFKKELEEAIEAGNISLNLINQVINHLQRVRNWGNYPSNNRGQMRRMVRRDSIDRARNLSYQVRHHLQLYDRELRDLGQRLSVQFNTDQFNDFTTFFFNNIITDWILQQKLTKALGSVAQTRKEVMAIQEHLETSLNKTDHNISSLKDQRERILES